jgi:hypothetical protein
MNGLKAGCIACYVNSFESVMHPVMAWTRTQERMYVYVHSGFTNDIGGSPDPLIIIRDTTWWLHYNLIVRIIFQTPSYLVTQSLCRRFQAH